MTLCWKKPLIVLAMIVTPAVAAGQAVPEVTGEPLPPAPAPVAQPQAPQPAPPQPATAKGDREPEVAQCAEAGGMWIGAAATEHPPYIPDGRCVVMTVAPEMPEDREALCAAYGGFWLPDKGDGIAACAYRQPKLEQ